jgi:hypothetical protein
VRYLGRFGYVRVKFYVYSVQICVNYSDFWFPSSCVWIFSLASWPPTTVSDVGKFVFRGGNNALDACRLCWIRRALLSAVVFEGCTP